MSDHQKLDQMIESMTAVLESIKAEELPVSKMIDEFTLAMKSYQDFEACIGNECMDVVEVKMDESGSFIESPFEWKNM